MDRHNYPQQNIPVYRPPPPARSDGHNGNTNRDDACGRKTFIQPHTIQYDQRLEWNRQQGRTNSNAYTSVNASETPRQCETGGRGGSEFHPQSLPLEPTYARHDPRFLRFNTPEKAARSKTHGEQFPSPMGMPMAPQFAGFPEKQHQNVGTIAPHLNQYMRPPPPPPPPPPMMPNMHFLNFNATRPPPPPHQPPQPQYPNSAISGSMQRPSTNTYNNHSSPQNQSSANKPYMGLPQKETIPSQFSNPPHQEIHRPCGPDKLDFVQHADGNTEDAKKTEDRQWICSLLTRRYNQPQSADGHCVKGDICSLPMVKQKLQEAILLSKELHNMSKPENIDLDSVDAGAPIRFAIVKEKLADLKKFFTDEKMLEALEKKVKRISRKRDCKRRQRTLSYERHVEDMAQRDDLHCKLDEWQHKIQEQSLQTKREKEMKLAADSILGEVHSKLADIRRSMDLLEAIAKLRKVRKALADTNGVLLPQLLNSNFEERKQTAISMLLKQKEIYDAEKKTLQVMLEIEKEETEERDKEASEQKIMQQRLRLEKRIRRSLFGPSHAALTPSDKLYGHRQYHEAASHDLQAFIAIREKWDKLLVPMNEPGGSTVPAHWVLPPEPSSDGWAAMLK